MTGPLVRQKVKFDPIVVRAFETRTGRVVGTIPYVGRPSWSFGINNMGAWSVTVPLDNPEVDKEWLTGVSTPWRFSWAICQGSKIWQAGPVITESYTGGNPTSIAGSGLWKLLSDKRLLINPARTLLSDVASAEADVVFGPSGIADNGTAIPAANQWLSLHTIAKRIVEIIGTASGGDLPIVYPDNIAGSVFRTYPGYDLASPGTRLFDLTKVIDGPEIEFRPEFVDEISKQQIRWRMRIGNSRLGNLGFPHAYDYNRSLVTLTYAVDGSDKSTRDVERGNGMNRDLVSGFYDHALPTSYDPAAILLETVGGDHSSSSNVEELNSYSQAAVVNNLDSAPTLGATIRIPGDDGQGNATRSPNFVTVEAGDNFLAQVRKHPRLPDGLYAFRLMAATSTGNAQVAGLQVQFLGRSAA